MGKVRVKYHTNSGHRNVMRTLHYDEKGNTFVKINGYRCYVEPVKLSDGTILRYISTYFKK